MPDLSGDCMLLLSMLPHNALLSTNVLYLSIGSTLMLLCLMTRIYFSNRRSTYAYKRKRTETAENASKVKSEIVIGVVFLFYVDHSVFPQMFEGWFIKSGYVS